MTANKNDEKDSKKASGNPSVQVFPVVGIGASAGGLEAIRKLLENLPETTGLAFVIIQHLAAGQESMLPEILSRSTNMPVQKVESGIGIEPNHVYVIPSGKIMTIHHGELQLQPKGMTLKPIDEFLRSLAAERKTRAIGIVLSGTGTDGTEGLKVIKAEGGITFAQDPKTAQYPDMPKNAIASETVYYILSPEKMAQELIRIAGHPELVRHEIETSELIEGNETNTKTIFTLLKASFGVNFANYKKSTISRRITRRMVLNKIENQQKYIKYLRAHKDELQALFDDLLIGVTGFFREPETFVKLRENVFPAFIEKENLKQPIRVWIPGCSTGEEAFSVAISLEEFLTEKNITNISIQIFGTDVNQKNVEKARKGVYLKSIEDSVSPARLKRFFISSNGNYQVTKQIRDLCVFAKHDLTKDPPFSNLDLIVCRNLLIYFDSQLQERIMPVFHYGLKANGYLVLGESESVGKFTFLFEPLTKRGILFKKKASQPRMELHLESPTTYSLQKLVPPVNKLDPLTILSEKINHLLMTEFVPASFVLNSNLDVLLFQGKINPYISVEPGNASLNISKIVSKELRPSLQTAVYRARKTGKEIKETVRLKQGKRTRAIYIQVKPVEASKSGEVFLVVLDEIPQGKLSHQKIVNVTKNSKLGYERDQHIKELTEDLESTKQTLQTVIEQQEATNEELRSSMEEGQSSNEELMSTNEELETAKEELQSSNEELTTLNDELKNRNQTLSLLNDDLTNLMGNVDTAVVILDNDFRIRRFTGSAQALLRLTPTDIDHPITDIRLGISIEELEKILTKAVNLEVVREEIQTEKGRWYQMRARPYLSQEKTVGGVVLSFSDITELKRFEGEKKNYTKDLEQKVRDQAGELVASESLAAVGKTAGMVGHDIRNPLQAIVSDIFLAKNGLATLPETEGKNDIRESLDGIEENIYYINKIVADLQDYARLTTSQLVEVDVEKSIQDVLTSAIIPENVQVSYSIQKSFPKMKLDATHFKRILTNLISNAIQALPNGGKVTINASCENGKTLITVMDDGVGMNEITKVKVFQPLFTTKSKGQGFGLAVVKKLTEAMGGKVSFVSEENKGTRFMLEFPYYCNS